MIKHKFIGSDLPHKDLIIGFDILAQLFKQKVYIKTEGLSYISYFHPWIKPAIYQLQLPQQDL